MGKEEATEGLGNVSTGVEETTCESDVSWKACDQIPYAT